MLKKIDRGKVNEKIFEASYVKEILRVVKIRTFLHFELLQKYVIIIYIANVNLL